MKKLIELEKRWIKERIKSDLKENEKILKVYNKVPILVKNELELSVINLSNKDKISALEAKKKISKSDIESYKIKAQNSNISQDSYKRIKSEARTLNISGSTNKETLLQRRIEIDLIELAEREERFLKERLNKEIEKEVKRQKETIKLGLIAAGITGALLKSKTNEIATKIEEKAKKEIYAIYYNATFSDRIWLNNRDFIEVIQKGIRRSILRGENPKSWINSLYKYVKDESNTAYYNARRLAISEVGRWQSYIQKESFILSGFEKYIYICEPGACPICQPLHETVHRVDEMVQGENAPMMHPCCKCGTAAYYEND